MFNLRRNAQVTEVTEVTTYIVYSDGYNVYIYNGTIEDAKNDKSNKEYSNVKVFQDGKKAQAYRNSLILRV